MREILCTAAVVNFLKDNPGEFTPVEIRRLATGFHVDNDEDDVQYVCTVLVAQGLFSHIGGAGYEAYKLIR